jgi:hypothetical protein
VDIRLVAASERHVWPQDILIRGNLVANNQLDGIAVYDGWPASIAIHENIITGNTPGVRNYLTEDVSATNNWWGDASGPSGEGSGAGDSVTTFVIFDPWRTGGIPALVNVARLEPSWTAPGGGGVYSGYAGPPAYTLVSPGSTAVYDGREAGIIQAGLATDPDDGHYWDDGIFGFMPTVTIDEFAARTLTYDVVNQYGENPVWMTIIIDTDGSPGKTPGDLQYQFVPTTNPTGWHTVDAAMGRWQLMDANGNGTGPLMLLSGVARAHTGLNVVRAYLRLGMGDSYHGIDGLGTVAWVDKATLGGVTYDFVVDTMPPDVTVPADITAEATGPDGTVVTFSASANDDVDGAIDPTCAPASGSTFPLGSTTVKCTATDSSKNEGSASFTVTVQDTTPPVLFGTPASFSVSATGLTTPVTYIAPTATDAVDPAPTVSCSPASGSTFPIGTTLVTCTATDAAGNVGTGTFNVTVNDVSTPGDMHGNGFVAVGSTKYHFNFQVSEDARKRPRNRFELQVDDHAKPGKDRHDRFVSTAIDVIVFWNNPDFAPGRKSEPTVDTVSFKGTMEWKEGKVTKACTFTANATDYGEPGKKSHELFGVTVNCSGGPSVILPTTSISGGNIQSRRLKH